MEEFVDVPKSEIGEDKVIAYDIDIEKDEIQEYTITFRYYDNKKIFSGRLSIEEGTGNPNIKYKVTLNGNDFSVDNNIKETIKNGSVEFNVIPNEGYTLGNVVSCDNGAIGVIENNKVIVSNITSDTICTLDNEIKEYIVQVTSNNNNYGIVSPTIQNVSHGSNAVVIITPNNGYKYSSNTCGGVVDGNTMTISNITDAKSCVVTFEKIIYVVTVFNNRHEVSTGETIIGKYALGRILSDWRCSGSANIIVNGACMEGYNYTITNIEESQYCTATSGNLC